MNYIKQYNLTLDLHYFLVRQISNEVYDELKNKLIYELINDFICDLKSQIMDIQDEV